MERIGIAHLEGPWNCPVGQIHTKLLCVHRSMVNPFSNCGPVRMSCRSIGIHSFIGLRSSVCTSVSTTPLPVFLTNRLWLTYVESISTVSPLWVRCSAWTHKTYGGRVDGRERVGGREEEEGGRERVRRRKGGGRRVEGREREEGREGEGGREKEGGREEGKFNSIQ